MANISDGSARWKVVNWKDKIEGMQTNLEDMMNLIASSLRREMNDLRNSITGGVEGSITEINENIKFLVPIGVILPFASKGVLPTGYTLCNGAEISRTEYPKLFEVIGTTFGSGNGTTTFNVPDLRNKFIEGSNASAVGTKMNAGLPNIVGTFLAAPTQGTAGTSGAISYNTTTSGAPLWNWQGTAQYGMTFNAYNYNHIYGSSTTVQPPAIMMQFIIRSY